MSKRQAQGDIEPLAVPLWPDTGRALGLGKNRTYESAKAGEIPTIPFGRTLRVPMWFYRQLRDGPTKPSGEQNIGQPQGD